MSAGSFHIDTSQWPIAIHRVEGALSNQQIDAYVDAGTTLLLRGERHVVILDTTRMGRFTAYARARSAQWQQTYRNELERYCLGTAYVVPSPLLRFIVMTVLLVGKLPTPYVVCDSIEEAMTWCRERLADAELRAPEP